MDYALEVLLAGKPLRGPQLSAVIEDLANYAPKPWERGGHTALSIALPATDLRQAIKTGLAITEHATRREVLSVEAMPMTERDLRLIEEDEEFTVSDELIDTAEAARILDMTRQGVAYLHNADGLPGTSVGRKLLFRRGDVERVAAMRRLKASMAGMTAATQQAAAERGNGQHLDP